MQGASLQSYDFTITAGQTMPLLASGNYFLIKSSTGALDVRGEFGQAKAMIAGQGLSGRDFTKLELKNNTGATITGLILIEDGAENGNGFFDLNLILSGAIVQRPEDGVYWKTNSVTALTVLTVVPPASNTNGLILQNAEIFEYNSLNPNSYSQPNLLIKTSLPANNFDGDLVLLSSLVGFSPGTWNSSSGSLKIPQKIPAGYGLYFAWGVNTAVLTATVKYKLI